MPGICSVDTSPLLYFYRIDQLIPLRSAQNDSANLTTDPEVTHDMKLDKIKSTQRCLEMRLTISCCCDTFCFWV